MTIAAPATLVERIDSSLAAAYEHGHVAREDGRTIPVWPAGMTADSGQALRRVVQGLNASRTLETGLALGMSTLWILGGSMSNHPDASHVAIDPFQARDWGNAGLAHLARAGVRERVEHIALDSALALPRLILEERTFDFALVDGGHLFENAFIDLHFATRLVRPGGLIALDDLWMPAIQAALDYFTSNVGLRPERASDAPGAERFVFLRAPNALPARGWDHFVPFSGMKIVPPARASAP